MLRYFTVYGPRQRPDMAFTAMLEALARGRDASGSSATAAQRGASRTWATPWTATIAAMERGRAGEIYNVGGGDEATMSEAIALAEEISGRTLDVERVEAAAGDVKRTKADVSKAGADLGWAPETALRDGLAAQWEWASVESPRVSTPDRSRRRARSRPPLRLGADRGALVAARARDRRSGS